MNVFNRREVILGSISLFAGLVSLQAKASTINPYMPDPEGIEGHVEIFWGGGQGHSSELVMHEQSISNFARSSLKLIPDACRIELTWPGQSKPSYTWRKVREGQWEVSTEYEFTTRWTRTIFHKFM